jgi:hypothetical protein
MEAEATNEKQGLEAFKIAGLPPDFYYIPNFISVEEEASILQKVFNHFSLNYTFRNKSICKPQPNIEYFVTPPRAPPPIPSSLFPTNNQLTT